MSDQVERALSQDRPTSENAAPVDNFQLKNDDASTQAADQQNVAEADMQPSSVDHGTVTDATSSSSEAQPKSEEHSRVETAKSEDAGGKPAATEASAAESKDKPMNSQAHSAVAADQDGESGDDESHKRAATDMESSDEHDQSFKRFKVEYAKSGRSHCRAAGCGQLIKKGELRVAKISKNPFAGHGQFLTRLFHLPCLFESFSRPQTRVKLTDEADLDGLDALQPEDQSLLRDLISGRKKPEDIAPKSAPAEKAPEQEADKPEASKPAARGRRREKKENDAAKMDIDSAGPAAAAGKRLTRQKRRSFETDEPEEGGEQEAGSEEQEEAEDKGKRGRRGRKGKPKAAGRGKAAPVSTAKRARASAQP